MIRSPNYYDQIADKYNYRVPSISIGNVIGGAYGFMVSDNFSFESYSGSSAYLIMELGDLAPHDKARREKLLKVKLRGK